MVAEEGEGHGGRSPILERAFNLSNLGLPRAALTGSLPTTVRAYPPRVGVRGALVGVRGEESVRAK